MVEKIGGGDKVGPDGVVRNVIYGKYRTDKEADKGYSSELVHCDLDPAYYDNIEDLPLKTPHDTLLKLF